MGSHCAGPEGALAIIAGLGPLDGGRAIPVAQVTCLGFEAIEGAVRVCLRGPVTEAGGANLLERDETVRVADRVGVPVRGTLAAALIE